MVVLTIVAPSNEHTVYFNQPLRKPNYVRLLSCSLYNSWFNLKKPAYLSYKKGDKTFISNPINSGHYTVDTLAEALSKAFPSVSPIIIKKNTPSHLLTIEKASGINSFSFNKNLSEFLNNRQENSNEVNIDKTYITQLAIPTSYFIHCDLVDKEQNLLNGKPSTLLAKFDIRGEAFEKVYYETSQQHVLRGTSTSDNVNSVTLSVTDFNGNVLDFNSMPLEFELEIC